MPMYWNGGGFGWIWMTVMMIVFWGVVIWGIVYFVRSKDDQRGSAGAGSKPAIDVLEERFARGEIDEKEFRERRDILLRR
jgi:putative membrane protein